MYCCLCLPPWRKCQGGHQLIHAALAIMLTRVSGVVSGSDDPRHDVIRTLFPNHYIGMLLPRHNSGCYRVGLPFSHQYLQTQEEWGSPDTTIILSL